jgi:hypothetical protein
LLGAQSLRSRVFDQLLGREILPDQFSDRRMLVKSQPV